MSTTAPKRTTTNPYRTPDGRMLRRLRENLVIDAESIELLADYHDFMVRKHLRPGSITANEHKLRLFAEYVNDTGLAGATESDVESFLDARSLNAKSRYAYVSMLATFYRWAVSYELIEKDPTLRVVRPRVPRSVPRPIPDADLLYAFEQADKRMRAILAFAAFHGLRAAEIAGVQREDILDKNTPPVIVVSEGKGGHQRVLPLHTKGWEMIRPWTHGRHGFLFTDEYGRAIPPHVVSHDANLYLHASVGTGSTLHSLRHWYGTKVYASCRDLRITQGLMGHASPNTTIGYVAWSAGDAHDAVAGLTIGSTP